MHDPDTIDVACGQFVQRYYILRIMVFDFQQVGDFPVRFLRQIAAHLHINALVPPHDHEVDFLGGVFVCNPEKLFEIPEILSTQAAIGSSLFAEFTFLP